MRLVTVAHGTRHGPGNDVARRLTSLAGRQLGLTAVASYVELCEPSLQSVLAGSSEPTAVVPLLLSSGHHVRHDLPASLAAAPGPVWLGDPLGPHPLLAEAQAARLRVAGALPGRPGGDGRGRLAGSDRPARPRRGGSAAGVGLGGPVTLAAPVRSRTAARRGRDARTYAVSPYLLAEGHFAESCRAEAARAECVADVVGVHPAVVELTARVIALARDAVA